MFSNRWNSNHKSCIKFFVKKIKERKGNTECVWVKGGGTGRNGQIKTQLKKYLVIKYFSIIIFYCM